MHQIPKAAGWAAVAIVASTICAGTATAEADQAVTASSVAVDSSQQQPSAGPADPGQEYLNAFTAITGAFANDSTAGRVVGTTIGVVVGCPLGAVTGGALTLPTAVLTPVGIVGGCIIGASTLGFLGGTVGSIVTGSPAMSNAFGQQYNSLHSKGLIAEEVPNPDSAQ
ncbi:hypothetical protein [Nocardia pseudovaccinii]|uniref:hypothetical protein n=1 Tax=Nocardia pseudovaccinii TaxID=189540 RepID=UPI0007A4CB74|nr:hypothetical protein [Nocardia pseudovaccinii]